MHLRQKTLLRTSLLLTLILIVTTAILYFINHTIILSSVIIFSIVFYFILYLLLYLFFMHRLEKLTAVLQSAKEKISQLKNEKISFPFSEKESTLTHDHLTQLAHYDELTTLPNRVFFNEMLNKSLIHAHRHQKKIAILFINLDQFRKINLEWSHQVGNKILQEISKRLLSLLSDSDILARLGGDEFVILLNNIPHADYPQQFAKKILQTCTRPICIDDDNIFVTTSIGICLYPDHGTSLEELQRHADIALYKAKWTYGSSYHIFSHEEGIESQKNIDLDKALSEALQNNEFVAHYQPEFELSSGAIISIETLVRWSNPDMGLIAPKYFLQAAEESGLILSIGEWVLYEACRANKFWQKQGLKPLCISVNLSEKQFNHVDIVEFIKNALNQTGLDPEYLEVEISENTLMQDPVKTLSILNEFKQLGIKICIDDFGTGFGSIYYLKQFQIDTLKIDHRIIKNIPEDQNNLSVTRGIISLGHHLGIQVCAKSVEAIGQLHCLAEHGCDRVQGYYFSRPVGEAEMMMQLTKEKKVFSKT